MTTSPREHYDLAGEYLDMAKIALFSPDRKIAKDGPSLLALAQVHATLANFPQPTERTVLTGLDGD